MKSSPKVAIILPVFNTEKYLNECLESIINQDWRIITSSAKPEKRIVAHKASIIEIVKITIEGAHEPLSSSYSSGQSIYPEFPVEC